MVWMNLNNGEISTQMDNCQIIPTDTKPENLENFLTNNQDVIIEFSSFRDGRGFSLAYLLRIRHNFQGRIIANGNLVPDQAQFLLRSGFTDTQINEKNLKTWQECAHRFAKFYQNAAIDYIKHKA